MLPRMLSYRTAGESHGPTLLALVEGLPAGLREVLGQLARSHETSVPVDRSESFLTNVGLATADALAKTRAILDFLGECVLAAQRLDDFKFGHAVVAAEVIVMPRSRSCSIQSIVAAPSCTSPTRWMRPV